MNEIEKIGVISSETLTIKDDQISVTESDYFRNSLSSVATNIISFNLPHFEKSHYEFIKQLGHGSLGKVYSVVKHKTRKEFAIKVFEKRILLQLNKTNHVLIEYELLSRLDHPAIIKTYGIYEDEEKLYIILDICKNKDLSTFLTNNFPLKISLIKYFTLNVLRALECLRDNKIIHRDIKPNNFLLDEQYNVVLVYII
jgi:3-phosphoinositide dependent protein kinase-1